MKTSLAVLLAAVLSTCSADVVVTPITEDQIVQKVPGDCFFGEVTPQGCGLVLHHVSCPWNSSCL